VIVIGAGGHGQVVADVLLSSRDGGAACLPVGYVDDDASLIGRTFLGLPVLGLVESLRLHPHDGVIVAIGDNVRRRSVFHLLERAGECFVVARHPRAVISPHAEIGPGTVICAGVVINPGTTIGSNVILNTSCSIDHHNRIGDHAHVGPGVRTGGSVTIGSGALIGIGAVVMPGRTVGAGSVVGAAALVQRDVGDTTVVAGVPARTLQRQTSPNGLDGGPER
jgi:sugar O-acyltransferase (sialic acid O-acetyltransferase NeuD family)